MVIEPKNPDKLKEELSKCPLVIFGEGGLGKRIIRYCKTAGITISAIADNDIEKQKTDKAISPQQLKKLYPTANIAITSNMYFKEIEKQLLDLGFPASQILPYHIFLRDHITWDDLEKDADWERMKHRVKQLAKYIDGEDKSVADYGAGHMFLRDLLPPDVRYYPVDYLQRTSEIILCDLNSGDFPTIIADVVVMGAVIEIITTSKKLIAHACATAQKKVIITHVTLDKFPDLDARKYSGYISGFTEEALTELFREHNFFLKHKETIESHKLETLFVFEKDKQAEVLA